MNKISKNENGFTAVELVLVLMVVVCIGAAGWLVYEKHHKTTAVNVTTTASNNKFTHTKPITTAPVSPTEVNYNSWKSVPNDMQAALTAEWLSVAPNGCQPSDTYQDEAESTITPQEPLVTYGDQFMIHGFGCDGGSVHILAKQSGTWQSIASSQDGWDCSLLQQYNVPKSLLQADNVVENAGEGTGLPVTCITSDGSTQTLSS